MIHAGYALLGLITFLTAGPKEARAWTDPARDPRARGGRQHPQRLQARLHLRRGGRLSRTISRLGGEAGAREAGKLRQEGRDYVVQDGDVIHFRFNV